MRSKDSNDNAQPHALGPHCVLKPVTVYICVPAEEASDDVVSAPPVGGDGQPTLVADQHAAGADELVVDPGCGCEVRTTVSTSIATGEDEGQ